VILRPYRERDAAATRAVFERAVRITASANYTSQQIKAWAPVGLDASACRAWAAARAAAQTIVAVADTRIVGFSDLVDRTRLDMLYVDPDVSRRGVGSALIARILSRARDDCATAVETYASLTARPLFERHGFVVIEQLRPVVRNVEMPSFKNARCPRPRMSRRLLLARNVWQELDPLAPRAKLPPSTGRLPKRQEAARACEMWPAAAATAQRLWLMTSKLCPSGSRTNAP